MVWSSPHGAGLSSYEGIGERVIAVLCTKYTVLYARNTLVV